jgi:hypothetical protein
MWSKIHNILPFLFLIIVIVIKDTYSIHSFIQIPHLLLQLHNLIPLPSNINVPHRVIIRNWLHLLFLLSHTSAKPQLLSISAVIRGDHL